MDAATRKKLLTLLGVTATAFAVQVAALVQQLTQ